MQDHVTGSVPNGGMRVGGHIIQQVVGSLLGLCCGIVLLGSQDTESMEQGTVNGSGVI